MSFFNTIKKLLDRDKSIKKEVSFKVEYLKDNIEITFNYLTEELNDILNMNEIFIDNNNKILIEYEELYTFYYDENGTYINIFEEFKFPAIFRGNLNIENRNNFFVDEEVKYLFSFSDLNGKYQIYQGNILISDLNSDFKIMPREMYNLVKSIKKYNSDIESRKEINRQFELLKEIKDQSEKIDVILNERLSSEPKPVIIEKVKVDFEDDGEVLRLYPKISEDETENREICKTIERYEDIKGVYSSNLNNERKRYVIKNKDALEKVINNKMNKGEQRLNLLKGNNEIFQDENIDISDFGPRVTGIGYLNYRMASSSVKNVDLDWFNKNQELHYIQGANIDGDVEKIILTPRDKETLQKKFLEMDIEGTDCIEVSFENGLDNKFIMTKEEIINEIENINSRIKTIDNINNKKMIEEILKEVDSFRDEEYITYNGFYIENKRDFKEQLEKKLENVNEETKDNKKKSLLIAENLEEEEYEEINKLKFKNNVVEIPILLKENISLFKYQEECLKKLQQLYNESNRNGFLLCDDMGLGKTLQLLSFLAWLKEKNELGTSLIVAPTSLLNNWDSDKDGEIQKFFKANSFSTRKVIGRISISEIEKLKNEDIIFTTYDSLRINSMNFGKINWKVMICDEAQKIKNPRTMVTIAAKAQNADFKIICSATPIENSLEDLWNLVDYSKPGLLGSLKNFKERYKRSETACEEDLKDVNDEIYSSIENFYIRREKDILPKALPKKNIKIIKVQANEIEKNVIDRIITTEDFPIVAIQKMLSVCAHPDLLNAEIPSKFNIDNFINKSSKLKLLKNILEEIRERNEKVIIFTRMKKIQKILYLAINKWFKIESSIVNGENQNLDYRTRKINKFRESKGFDIIILSPEVAGFGLTLTEANNVIHYTRLWNPAKEDQATDRVYRIGQDKEVTVYYPMISFGENSEKNYNDINNYIEENTELLDRQLSPEEKLNILLAIKKKLLINFFLAAGNGEINTNDFMGLGKDNIEKKKEYIKLSDIENNILSEKEIEALVGVVYEKEGYEVYLKPTSDSTAISFLAINKDKCIFVSCLSNYDEKDFEQARKTYQKIVLNKEFLNHKISLEEEKYSENNLKVIYKEEFSELLEKYKVLKKEVDDKNKRRYSYESLKIILDSNK